MHRGCCLVEAHTRQQSEDSLWFQQRHLRLTASNFGKVAKRRDSTLVANLVKTLFYGKMFSTAATQWGLTHEEDTRAAYIQYLRQQGHSTITTSSSGLVIVLDEPCLACSPDSLVDIPELADLLGIYELKCPHTLAKESMTPQAAAAPKKGFFCKVGPTGAMELRRNHDYFYQVQGTLAITKRS